MTNKVLSHLSDTMRWSKRRDDLVREIAVVNEPAKYPTLSKFVPDFTRLKDIEEAMNVLNADEQK